MTLTECLSRSVSWRRTGGGEFPYKAVVFGREWLIRINDFPAFAMYTLMVDGREVGDFDDWPAGWQRPD